MDKASYKVSMSLESVLLVVLMSTIYLTSLVGQDSRPLCEDLCTALDSNSTTGLTVLCEQLAANSSSSRMFTAQDDCVVEAVPTSLATKAVFAVWVWAIFFTFPGTFSTQPAVTTQTFGHKYGGFIYAFLFSSDIVNNLMVATMSKAIKEQFGWLGLFLIVSAWGFVALLATAFYPYKPSPGPRPARVSCQYPWLAKIGLVEIDKDV